MESEDASTMNREHIRYALEKPQVATLPQRKTKETKEHSSSTPSTLSEARAEYTSSKSAPSDYGSLKLEIM